MTIACIAAGADLFAASQRTDNGHTALPIATKAQLAIAIDAGWSATTATPPAFFWSGVSLPITAADTYMFTSAGQVAVSITDDFNEGDRFRVYDNTVEIGTTPSVPVGSSGEVGPDAAFADPAFSSGTFLLPAGSHEISIEVIEGFTGGRGYIRVDSLDRQVPTLGIPGQLILGVLLALAGVVIIGYMRTR